jgi:tetratricopeptide (TPR) repeat protein
MAMENQGKFEEAEVTYRRALAAAEKASENVESFDFIHKLGHLLDQQGKYEEAKLCMSMV